MFKIVIFTGPLFVVVEYCGHGNLLKYLQKNQMHAKTKQEYVNILPTKSSKLGIQYVWKLEKALEICHGMAHLAKFKVTEDPKILYYFDCSYETSEKNIPAKSQPKVN